MVHQHASDLLFLFSTHAITRLFAYYDGVLVSGFEAIMRGIFFL